MSARREPGGVQATGTMLDAALEYAAHGDAVFPTWWSADGRCACGASDCSAAKHPIPSCAPNGLKNATTDAATIRGWWGRFPQANIATRTGVTRTVLDVDPGKGGDETLAQLEAQYGALPTTPRVNTGGGGEHYHFAPVPGLRNSAGKIGPGVDVRGEDGYVLLPPSNHVSGGIYSDDPGAPLYETAPAPMPAWLVALATQPTGSQNGDGGPSEPTDWAALLAGAPDGQRHAVALKIAGHFLGLLGPARAAEVEGILLGFAARCPRPFPADEVRRIVCDLAARDAKTGTDAHRGAWAQAQPAPAFLAVDDGEGVDWFEPRLLAPGIVTYIFAPRGLGKSHVAHALGVRLAKAGRRVLLMDRDNSRREIKRRLRAWGAGEAPALRVLTRDHAPPLMDAAAWHAFPVDGYELVMIDSLDAATEGVGEKDSARPSRALAAVLDIARRPGAPAFLVLGNTIKSAEHSRGSGVVEDRGDIVYEVRDATDLQPTGRRAWWLELPPAGAAAWGERAARRKRRESYRLAFIASKFRVGEEPEPFVLEVRLGGERWELVDVTGEVVAAGEGARDAGEADRRARFDGATTALAAEVAARAGAGAPLLADKEGVPFLVACGLKRAEARELLAGDGGGRWRRSLDPTRRGRPALLIPVCHDAAAAENAPLGDPHECRGSEPHFSADRMNTGRRKSSPLEPASIAAMRAGAFPPPGSGEPTRESPAEVVEL